MAKKASAVRFSTAAYQFAHGKAPRGTGLMARVWLRVQAERGAL